MTKRKLSRVGSTGQFVPLGEAAKLARTAINQGRVAEGVAKGRAMPDDSNPEWTEADFAKARPADEVHGPEIAAQMVRKRGRPPLAEGERKEAVKLRLSPEVLAHFRAGGPGWQTRIDDTLKAQVAAASRPTGLLVTDLGSPGSDKLMTAVFGPASEPAFGRDPLPRGSRTVKAKRLARDGAVTVKSK